MKTLATLHGELALPAFLPDATRGVVRTVDAADVAACGIAALMVNVIHLASHPGISVVSKVGGIHRFMGWNRPIASDSGGFQVFSLVTGSRKLGSISKDGFIYRLDKSQDKKILTPEKCIRKQLELGADILFSLDHCTHPDADAQTQRESVEHTVDWARRCRIEFDRRLEDKPGDRQRPLLFAIVQGGADAALRRECADRLIEIGFDGYGYGGWPIDDDGKLVDMVAHAASLLPPDLPKHALGIGKPGNLVRAYDLGYDLFDCVMPTRDARHKRLFVFEPGWERAQLDTDDFYRCLYIQDATYVRDAGPLDAACDCPCCRNFPRAYLHHLFQIDEPLALRLATLHNLRFYARLIERLQSRGRSR